MLIARQLKLFLLQSLLSAINICMRKMSATVGVSSVTIPDVREFQMIYESFCQLETPYF